MLNKKKLFLLILLPLIGIFGLWAGDVATFTDLGFSADGNFYMFSQHGIQHNTLIPWANLYIVDVARNDFVPNGRVSYVHEGSVRPGLDGSGAFLHLLSRNISLAERWRINHNLTGHLLYVNLEGGNSRQPIEFRHFEGGDSYRATLVPTMHGTGANLSSSFIINLERTMQNGTRRNYIVGTPQARRPNIISYSISRVMVSPDRSSMILVIEMHRQEGDTTVIRYMVEALKL